MTKDKIDMRVYIKEQCELAIAYAEDGAYVSAQRIILNLAEELTLHVMKLKREGLIS